MGLKNYAFFLNTNQDLIQVLPNYVIEHKYYLILPSKYKSSKVHAFCKFLNECIQRFHNYEQEKPQLD